MKKGFTLIELLVVAIIGIHAVGVVAYNVYKERKDQCS